MLLTIPVMLKQILRHTGIRRCENVYNEPRLDQKNLSYNKHRLWESCFFFKANAFSRDGALFILTKTLQLLIPVEHTSYFFPALAE